MVHRGGVKIKDFLEDMTPLFNEIVIFKSEKFRFKKPKKKKIDFKTLKNNTCKSLNEVEYFLNNFQKFTNCIKLYKILK